MSRVCEAERQILILLSTSVVAGNPTPTTAIFLCNIWLENALWGGSTRGGERGGKGGEEGGG